VRGSDWAVIFDMDGVLVDTLPLVLQAFNELLAPHGIVFTEEDQRRFNGMKVSEAIRLWEQEYGVRLDEEAFLTGWEEREAQLFAAHHAVDARLTALLEALHAAGARLAVATSSRRSRTDRILGLVGYARFFPVVVTGDDIAAGKPAPDLYLAAAARLGVVPARCVVIEDAPKGIAAAKAAGETAVGLVTRLHAAAQLSQADLVVSGFDELDVDRLRALATKGL